MSDTDMTSASAWQQIHNVITGGAHAQDGHDWVRYGETFAVDARYVHPKGELEGRDAIVDRSRKALTPLDASQHLVGSVVIDVDGDTAHAVSYFVGQHVRADAPGASLFVIAGTYDDQFERRDGRWQIAVRTQSYSWRDGNPDVIVR